MKNKLQSIEVLLPGYDAISIIDNTEKLYKENQERKKNKKRVKQFGNCKFCNIQIERYNYYRRNVCINCIRYYLQICEEDCLNCIYPECLLYIGSVKRKKILADMGIEIDFDNNMGGGYL